MAKILVTGGAGFIGSNLVDDLIKRDNEIVIVDDLSMGLKSNIPNSDKVIFYEDSVTNYDFMKNLLLRENFDYIFLLAAVASVADSVDRPMETHEINQNANLFILDTIRTNKLPVKKLLFASSAAIYGDEPTLPKVETSEIRPLTPYAVDKFATERFVIDYGTLYGMNTVAVRFFNVYGPKQNPSSPYSGVLSIVANCLKDKKDFQLFGDGEQTRDFVYVQDVVNALLMLVKDPTAKHTVFNIATGKKTSLNKVIDIMQEVSDTKLNIIKKPGRDGDIHESYANVNKLSTQGYVAKYSLNEGLRNLWESLAQTVSNSKSHNFFITELYAYN